MGASSSSPLRQLVGKAQMQIIIIGLAGAGKTTLLHSLGLGEVLTTIPAIGCNVETAEYQNLYFTSWDVGGQVTMEPLFQQSSSASRPVIVFVVDSNDDERIEQARYELQKLLLNNKLRGSPLLVLANKQDLPDVMSVEEVADRLLLPSLQDRQWHIQGLCAWTGAGLDAGLGWLSSATFRRVRHGADAAHDARERNAVDMPGRYCVVAKSLDVLRRPGVDRALCCHVGRVPRGTCIDVVVTASVGSSGQHFGRIAAPVAGWVRLVPSYVKAVDLVAVTLHVAAQPTGRSDLLCYSMGGEVLVSLPLDDVENLSLADLRMLIADRVGVAAGSVTLVLPCGRLLADFDEHGSENLVLDRLIRCS